MEPTNEWLHVLGRPVGQWASGGRKSERKQQQQRRSKGGLQPRATHYSFAFCARRHLIRVLRSNFSLLSSANADDSSGPSNAVGLL